MPGPVNKMVNKALMVPAPKELIVQLRDDTNAYEFYLLLVLKFIFSLLETVSFPPTSFRFGLWKNTLRLLSGPSCVFRGLGSGSCTVVCSGRLSIPGFSRKLPNGHPQHLHAFRPVGHLRLSSKELRS